MPRLSREVDLESRFPKVSPSWNSSQTGAIREIVDMGRNEAGVAKRAAGVRPRWP